MTDAVLWMAVGAALNGAFLAWLWKPWLTPTDEPTGDCSVGCFVCGWRAEVPQEFISAAVQVHADTCPGMEHDE